MCVATSRTQIYVWATYLLIVLCRGALCILSKHACSLEYFPCIIRRHHPNWKIGHVESSNTPFNSSECSHLKLHKNLRARHLGTCRTEHVANLLVFKETNNKGSTWGQQTNQKVTHSLWQGEGLLDEVGMIVNKWWTCWSMGRAWYGKVGFLTILMLWLVQCTCCGGYGKGQWMKMVMAEDLGGCIVLYTYDYTWVHEKGFNFNYVVLPIHMVHRS